MNRSHHFGWVLGILCFVPLWTFAKDPATAPSMDALAPLVGHWVIDTKWLPDGKALRARSTVEWGPGMKFLVMHTFVSREDGGEYERYLEVWAIEDGKLMDHVFSVDGASHTHEMEMEGKVLRSHWAVPEATTPTTVQQEVELTDANTFVWRVWLKHEGKREQIMDGTWKREDNAKAEPGKEPRH